MRQRALILCDKSAKTSFGRLALSFRRALQEAFDARILWLACPQDFPHGTQEESDPVLWAKGRLLGRWSFPRGLHQMLHASSPDWVILIRPELGFLVPFLRQQTPKAKLSLMVHDTFAETLYPHSLKFRLINHFWIQKCDHVDGFLFNSEWTHQEATKAFSLHGPQTICGCVVDPKDFYPLTQDAPSLKRKWEQDPERPVVLHLSLDEPRKNIPMVLSLAREFPQLQFVRIGQASPWIQQRMRTEGIGNVIHRKGLSLEELREHYSMADVTLLPSFLEGFGYPALESLACGTPVIASNTSAMAEILPNISDLLDPMDLMTWKRALSARLHSGKSLSPLVSEQLSRFSPQAFTDKILSHWNELRR